MSQVMKKHTIEILNSLDKNAREIRISNRNISGVLDMSEFKNLVHLNCNSNNITWIIGLSDKLERLACGFNNIKNLSNLPAGLKFLCCSEIFYGQIDESKFSNLSISWVGDVSFAYRSRARTINSAINTTMNATMDNERQPSEVHIFGAFGGQVSDQSLTKRKATSNDDICKNEFDGFGGFSGFSGFGCFSSSNKKRNKIEETEEIEETSKKEN